MNFKLLTEYDFNRKILNIIKNECTPFAIREGRSYEGWAVETVDCNGPEPAIYTNDGQVNYLSYTDTNVGIRPAVNFSAIKELCTVKRFLENGCLEVEYGEYPQEIVEAKKQEQLVQDLLDGKLEKTGKKYTIFNQEELNHNTISLVEVVDEIGNKYVNKNNVWYRVSPVRWIVNEKANLALTKYIISGGIPYGEYVKPQLSPWQEEFERKMPMKNPPSLRKMYELRKTNPAIIEGFLHSVLPNELVPSKTKKMASSKPEFYFDPSKEYDIFGREMPSLGRRRYDTMIMRNQPYIPFIPKEIFGSNEPDSKELLDKLIASLDDEKIEREAARRYLHPQLGEEYVEGKRALRLTLENYRNTKK